MTYRPFLAHTDHGISLEFVAAMYEAYTSDREFIGEAMRTSFDEAESLRQYRTAAETIVNKHIDEWQERNL